MKVKTFLICFVGALTFVACSKGEPVECGDSVRNKNYAGSVKVECPANCSSGSVWGVGPYTSDSSICRAAIHAGVIQQASGGSVNVTVTAGQDSYAGSEANGVTSREWGSYPQSFTVE